MDLLVTWSNPLLLGHNPEFQEVDDVSFKGIKFTVVKTGGISCDEFNHLERKLYDEL
jgi:hypothetical protein